MLVAFCHSLPYTCTYKNHINSSLYLNFFCKGKQHGKILSVETPEKITAGFPEKPYQARSGNNYLLLLELRKNPGVKSAFMSGEYLHIVFNGDADKTIPNLTEIMPTVEDCFIYLIDN